MFGGRSRSKPISVLHCVAVTSVVAMRRFLSVALHTISGMGVISREEIVEVFTALDADLDRLCELSFDVFTAPEPSLPICVWSQVRSVPGRTNPAAQWIPSATVGNYSLPYRRGVSPW